MPPVAKVCIQKPGYWRISEEFKMTFRGLKQKRNKRGKNEHWHTPTHTLRAFRSNRFMSKEWWKVFVFKGSDKQLPNQCVGKQGSFGGGAVSCLLLSDKALAGWWEKHHVLPHRPLFRPVKVSVPSWYVCTLFPAGTALALLQCRVNGGVEMW